jgi:APA family basic amino acid/polyamine antiporter
LPLGTLPGGLSSALTLAFISVLWSYGGWQHASFTSAEAKDPKRSVPLSLIFGALIVTVVYLSANLAYMFLLSPAQMAASPRIAAEAISVVLGSFGGSLIAITIFISTFGTTGIYTLTAPRIYYAMATDGVFFRRVAEIHPRYQTPMFAIIFQSVWAIVLILFWGTFESLISYVVFTDWIFFALTGASIFIFRKRMPDASRPYRTVGYPFTPAFFVLVATWFVLNTLIERPSESWAGIMFLALGVPVYYFWRRKNKARPV